jgi:hypothetical protein
MAQFLDLPPEIRLFIYNALLVDPIREGSRLVCTVDASGESSWSRTTGHLLTENKRTTDRRLKPIKSSVSHIDYSDLWSLASVNKVLYLEATPTMYSHAQLEYTSGGTRETLSTLNTHKSSTLLHAWLEKMSPTTSALYHDLTISYGRGVHLSAKDMKVLVDLINLRLSNLLYLNIQAVNPAIEAWPHFLCTSLAEDAFKTLAAARPVARLTSRPSILIKPRARLHLELEMSRETPTSKDLNRLNLSRFRKITRLIVGIRDWRCRAQDYHANACQRDDYLLLTSFIRSNLAGAAETDAAEVLDGMEDELAKHQKVLSRLKLHETFRKWEVEALRKLRR